MYLLRKITMIVLIASMVVPSAVFHFAADLPEIIGHYEHHNREHESVNFVAFLLEHAIEGNHPDAEHPEHNGFPEHHHTSSCHTAIFIAYIPPSQPFFEWSTSDFDESKTAKINRYYRFHPSEFASSIWQPPRIS
jgi:hypothetical protein